MAKLIEEIAGMTQRGQEFVLENLQKQQVPITVDGILYMIPKEVSELIEMLVSDSSEKLQNQQNRPPGF